MKSAMRVLLLTTTLVLGACGGSSNPPLVDGGSPADGGSPVDGGSPPPSVAITSPTANQAVTVHMTDQTGGPDLPVAYTVTNFSLKAPGTCGSVSKNCGHIHLLIDGSACNDVGSHAPYNSASIASPATAGFDYCPYWPNVMGSHTITLELHADDHTAVTDSTGAVVKATVTVMVTVAP
jgi:hypothetical protein